jgi:hypothetical protein
VHQVAAEAGLRVALHPQLDLVLQTVAARGIVARGVGADAVREGLDVRGAAPALRPALASRDKLLEREDVVAVDCRMEGSVGATLHERTWPGAVLAAGRDADHSGCSGR